MANVTFRHAARHVTMVDVELDGMADRGKFLLTSDLHLDAKDCLTSMVKRHFDKAMDEGAYILDNGDLCDLMQGRNDKRGDKSQLRPEFLREDYFDAVVEYVVDFLEPYADRIILLGRGNHETSVKRHNEIDITERIVGILNSRKKSRNILSAGYSGWVFFRLKAKPRFSQTVKLYRHHGYGGAAPVTKGVIQHNRMAAWLPDAHIVVTGHTHTEWVVPHSRMRINNHGTLYYDEQLHVRIPGAKAAMQDGFEGWEVEKGFAPLTTGSMWLELGFSCEKRMTNAARSSGNRYPVYDVVRLK